MTVFRRCHTRRSAWADPLGCQWFGVEQHFSNRLSVILRNCLLQGCQKTSELQWCPAQSGPVVTCDLFSDAPAGCCTSIASSGGADFKTSLVGIGGADFWLGRLIAACMIDVGWQQGGVHLENGCLWLTQSCPLRRCESMARCSAQPSTPQACDCFQALPHET